MNIQPLTKPQKTLSVTKMHKLSRQLELAVEKLKAAKSQDEIDNWHGQVKTICDALDIKTPPIELLGKKVARKKAS